MNCKNYDWVLCFSTDKELQIFSSFRNLTEYVAKHSASGIATLYPINISVYDWSVKEGFFTVKRATQAEKQFVMNFSSASQPHFHFECGIIRSNDIDCRNFESLLSNSNQFLCVMGRNRFPSAIFDDLLLLNKWMEKWDLAPELRIILPTK